MQDKVLWLLPPDTSSGTREIVTNGYSKPSRITFRELSVGAMRKKPKTKNTWELHPAMIQKLEERLHHQLELVNPKVVVINDRAMLEFITGKYTKLSQTRGSVYYYEYEGRKVPCIVIDDPKSIFKMKYNRWIFKKDLAKIYRWANDKQIQSPKLNYCVVRSLEALNEFEAVTAGAHLISIDIETSGTNITCIGYACLQSNGKILTYVIPFYYADGAFWDTKEKETKVWKALRRVHAGKNFKVFQNGSYDTSHLLTHRLPTNNYIIDSLHLWHSVWCELPKKIYFQASILLDFYRYWKDEGKEEAAEDDKNLKVPVTEAGFEDYWLYNAMDCHMTLCCAQQLMRYVYHYEWALVNFIREFSLQFGPLLFANMTCPKIDPKAVKQHAKVNWAKHYQAKRDLLTMVNDANFNPNSPAQVKILIYEVLNAHPLPRKGKSTDEKILKELRAQSLLLRLIIDQIWAVKKPANNASKYGDIDKISSHGRFRTKFYAAATPTERLASKASDFWIGTNAQNVPKTMRDIIIADDGMLLGDADYSQSDAYFTAYSCGDENFIRTMQGVNGSDTHCYHASMFFKQEYQKLAEAHERSDPWTDHPIRGIRNVTKRIVYGSNYFMMGYTLLITMGREATISTAQFMGHADANKWSVKQLANFCDSLLALYYELYPEIIKFIDVERYVVAKNGNRVTNCWGYSRIFFNDLVKQAGGGKKFTPAIREFAAFFGQSGTAGNINKAMMKIHKAWREGLQVQLFMQVHDSIIFQFPENRLDIAHTVRELMMNECTIRGETFVVPADVKVGKDWKNVHTLK